MIGMKALFAMLAAALGGPTISPARPGYMAKRRPTGAALRQPLERFQSDRLVAAGVKRERKADKLHRDAARSAHGNDAHFVNGAIPARLNPFHVAH